MKKVLALCAVVAASPTMAEPADVPNIFLDGSPAVAEEVNANFQAIVNVLGGIKRQHLYQNSTQVGSAFLANIMLLNSGYLTAVEKFHSDTNIYLTELLNVRYHVSGNCTGIAYTDKTIKHDLGLGEVGIVAAVAGQAYYQTFPATAVSVELQSVFEDGACTGRDNFTPASTFQSGPCLSWPIKSQLVRDRTYWCESWDAFVLYGGLLEGPVYPLAPNGSAVTGIMTHDCSHESKPAVCLTNASIVTE